jgi:hypothetical protein
MASTMTVTRQARLLAGVAITGSIPLTLGAIFWIVGTVMGAAYHGHWHRTAGLGEGLVLVGLICGLIMFVFAAAGERLNPRGSWSGPGGGGRVLMPLASPEQQAFLADPQRPDAETPITGPMRPPAGMRPPGPPTPPGAAVRPPAGMPPWAGMPSPVPRPPGGLVTPPGPMGPPAQDEPPDWPPMRDWFDPADPRYPDDQAPPPYPAFPDA